MDRPNLLDLSATAKEVIALLSLYCLSIRCWHFCSRVGEWGLFLSVFRPSSCSVI